MDIKPFVYGGIGSVTAEFGTFPLDLTKTRLQVQGQTIDKNFTNVRYRGMLHALRTIVKEEGVTALYSGFSPAALRQATYGTVKIGIYTSMKRHYCPNASEETLLVNIWCGLVAGVTSQCIFNPTDVLKVRMQVEKDKIGKRGLLKSFIDIYHKEGLAGLYRGVGPTGARAAIVVAAELPAYDICKKHLISSGYFGDNIGNHFISSVVAGLSGALTSTPIDTIKSRVMSQRKLLQSASGVGAGVGPAATAALSPGGATSAHIYQSSWHCLTRTVCDEGLLALWKGFIPTWSRLGPWNVIFFITLEQLYKL